MILSVSDMDFCVETLRQFRVYVLSIAVKSVLQQPNWFPFTSFSSNSMLFATDLIRVHCAHTA
jgi:hypothetical protein